MNPEEPVSLWPNPDALGPVTDLYELTMIVGYFACGMADRSTSFELFVRKMPPNRAYLVFAGLEQAMGDLLRLAFSPEQIEAIRQWPVFQGIDRSVLDSLAGLRFEGDVWAMPEGTVVFPGETLLRITAPLAQAQWVETYLVAALAYPTLVASKAARMVTVAGGRPLYEFGATRTRSSRGVPGGTSRVPRRLRGNEPRRGCPAAGHPRVGHDGPLVGSSLCQ